MKFKITISEVKEFEAKNLEEAQDIAVDVVNDIGKYGEYKVEEVK